MKENKYNIETVEFYYNGNEQQNDSFLSMVMHNYISTDKTLPESVESLNSRWTSQNACDMFALQNGKEEKQ